MKLQYLIIIFIIIALPMILILTHYTTLEKETIGLQTSYDSKLEESVKQAMEAFEINTVEWDNNSVTRYSDSKRRDIQASINTFNMSYANSLHLTGITRDSILTYIPALMYNLYDGFYIYTPTSVPLTINNDNGIQLFQDGDTNNAVTSPRDADGNINNILYLAKEGYGESYTYEYTVEDGAGNEQTLVGHTKNATINIDEAEIGYKHMLKTFVPYSEKVEHLGNTYAINYSLDNFIRVYGKDGENSIAKEGYLIDTSKYSGVNTIEIKYKNVDIKPEELSENIMFFDENGVITYGCFRYVYNMNNEKFYYDEDSNVFFRVVSNKRIYLDNTAYPGSETCEYKKVSLVGNDGKIINLYQPINGPIHWFFNESILDYTPNQNYLTKVVDHTQYDLGDVDVAYAYRDFSAINYYTQSYVFTNWVQSLGIEFLNVGASNDPENESSLFYTHKTDVMKNTIIANLNLAISSYSAHSQYDFSLPIFTYTDWNQILSNVSMTAFVQNIPIGLKYYNNYVIAISSNNKEYINPNDLYYISNEDYYYHHIYCDKIANNKADIAYRGIDFITQKFDYNDIDPDTGEIINASKYYFKHAKISESIAHEKCYYCLITQNPATLSAAKDNYREAYLHAIARERYIQAK